MPRGMTSVTSRLSARRMVSSISMRVCAATAFALTFGPSRVALAGEPQEHVFEAATTGAQLADERALFAQPRGECRDQGRRGGGVDEVVARPELAHGPDRDPE